VIEMETKKCKGCGEVREILDFLQYDKCFRCEKIESDVMMDLEVEEMQGGLF